MSWPDPAETDVLLKFENGALVWAKKQRICNGRWEYTFEPPPGYGPLSFEEVPYSVGEPPSKDKA